MAARNSSNLSFVSNFRSNGNMKLLRPDESMKKDVVRRTLDGRLVSFGSLCWISAVTAMLLDGAGASVQDANVLSRVEDDAGSVMVSDLKR